jgi:hypothetical protein
MRVLAHSTESAKKLPSEVETMIGDLNDRAAFERAFSVSRRWRTRSPP